MLKVYALLALFSTTLAFAHTKEQIQDDIVRDARNHFRNVIGKTWQLSNPNPNCASIEILPSGAFAVTNSRVANQFDVRLIDPSRLLNALQEIDPIEVQSLACSDVTTPGPDATVGALFTTSTGAPLDVENLKNVAGVTEFSLSWSPYYAATQTGIEGNKVLFQRAPGYGQTEIKVELSYKFNGRPYKYTVNLPKINDGYVWAQQSFTNTIKIEGMGLGLSNLKPSGEGSTRSEAERRLEVSYRHAASQRCQLVAEQTGYLRQAQHVGTYVQGSATSSVDASSYECSPDCDASGYGDDRTWTCTPDFYGCHIDCTIGYVLLVPTK